MRKLYNLLLLLFVINVNCFAQLNNFNLSVTPTPATCAGNGILSFTTSGTNPDANLSFTIYLLPNATTPIATTPSTTLTGLNPGTYKVVALQSLGASNNSQEQEVTIINQIVPLVFTLTGTGANCLGGGTLTAIVTNGNPVSYQIISGPITTPIQTSNTFTNLPPGNYNVRVIDNCGQGVVRSSTITETISNPNAITILENELPALWASQPKPACDLINIGQRIEIVPGANVVSPLQFVFTVFPPNGGPAITVTHSITISPLSTGVVPDENFLPFSFQIPYFDSSYTYNLEVIDGCGNSYFRNNNVVDVDFDFNFGATPNGCNFTLRMAALYYSLPLTVEFLSAPAGFNPLLFNSQHPTFNSGVITYQTPAGAPAGTYVVKVTDACGREVTKTTTVEDNVIALSGYSIISCTDIIAYIFVPSRDIVSGQIIQAPASSNIALPYDIAPFISNGTVSITGILIPGTYVITVTDSCGKVHAVPMTIVLPSAPLAIAQYFNGCSETVGSVRLVANGAVFVSATFISGPASYQPGFPHDVSFNIAGNGFSMNSLPIGIYVIRTVDTCGNIRNNTLFIGGYFSDTEIEITRFCSSFDLVMQDVNNNPIPSTSYWIQMKNPITGEWGHPLTGVGYAENTIPTINNSRKINNYELNANIGDSGQYRILNITEIANNGNYGLDLCIHIIKEFTVEGTTAVNSILNFACSSTASDVYIDVSGTGPFNFRILEMNGAPYVIDNQHDPMFTNLQTGIYKFQIEDDCGNLTVLIHDVYAPIIFAINPLLCSGNYSTLSVPDFPYLDYEWFKEGAEGVILSTDPIFSINALDFNLHSGVYYVNIIYPPNLDSCLNRMLSFEITPNIVPNAGNDLATFICDPQSSIDLNTFLSGNFDENGTWEQINPDGTLTANVWNTSTAQNGIYQFKYIVNGFCGLTDEAVIRLEIIDQIPIPEIAPINEICAGTNVNLSVTNGNASFTYSWTGPNNFNSNEQNPFIENININGNGTYNVVVSAGSCQVSSSINISVNALPDFVFVDDTIILCGGQSSTLQVVPTNIASIAYEYRWFFNNVEIPGEVTASLVVHQAGTYSVIISSGNCSITKTIEVTENIEPFLVGINATCNNNSFTMTAFAIDSSFNESAATYEWSGPNNFSATTQSVNITNLETGIYTVITTNENGCIKQVSTQVSSTFCRIPKGVSPNDDGQNDTWDLGAFDILLVKIFNRYGLEVYDQKEYKNQWYGQSFNGKMLPNATYYYYIKFKSGEEATGWVYLNTEK